MSKKLLILLIFISSIQYGQIFRNNFSHFNEKDGISSDYVNSIIQSKLGYIYIGTSNGFTRYDGYDFLNYTVINNDSNFLQLPLSTNLFEDSENNIWIGAVSGITKFDPGNNSFKLFDFYHLSSTEDRTYRTSSICETKEGDILLGISDFNWLDIQNGLLVIRKNSKTVEKLKLNVESVNAVLEIERLNDDDYLLSGFDGLFRYNHSKNVILKLPFNVQHTVMSIELESENVAWLGVLNEGVYKYNLNTHQYEQIKIPRKNNFVDEWLMIWDIEFDQYNKLLCATNYGLVQIDPENKNVEIIQYDQQNPSALNSYDLSDIMIDRSGSIWIGTSDLGLKKYNPLQNNLYSFHHNPNNPESIPNGWVNLLFEYNQNEVWIRAGGNQLHSFNRAKQTFKPLELNYPSHVNCIYKDKDDVVWFGGGYGLHKLDTKTMIVENTNINLNMNEGSIREIYVDSNDKFWIGTGAGLYTYDHINNLTAKIDFELLGLGDSPSNNVNNITEDLDQNIWFGTDNGLFKYDHLTKQYSRVGYSGDSSKALNSQDINALYLDKFGYLWAGTWLGGLNKIDISSGKIISYSKNNGLNAHSIQGILGDEDNDALWLSSFDGIIRFDFKEEIFQHFGIEDGIQGLQFADKSRLKTKDGQFMFGGQKGITIFRPDEIKQDLIPPEVVITDFKIFNKSVVPGENSLLNNPVYRTKVIELDYDQNDISFEYLAVHYANPLKNKYAYMLENYEDNWRYVGNQRNATYPNIPPGDYIFRVKASNNNDVWNEEGKYINIKISSPPWATWWAYSSYIILFLGFLYSIRKIELTRQKKNTEIKESKLRAQAAELQAKAAEAQSQVMQVENDRKTKELEEARELQLSMLPKDIPQLPHLDIAVYMNTATEVGGDYYDFHIGMDGKLTVVLGDATGHGMKAGTMVTSVKSLFNVLAPNPNILETFHEITNALKQMHMEKLSMCMTMLKISGKKVEMSASGMPPVLIYKTETQIIEEHVMKGMPLGTFSNFPYELISTTLDSGDTILLMSDGFPELVNGQKEMYGYKRARNLFEEIAYNTPEEIIDKLKDSGSKWSGDKDPDDDVTFVVIKVK